MPMSPAERQAKLDNWIADLEAKGKLSAEALASVKSAVSSPEAVEYIVGSQLRQQESDKWYQESQKLQGQLKSDIENLTNWRKEAQAQIDKANLTVQQTAKEKADIERLYMEARTKIATNYENVDQATLNELLPVPQQGASSMPQNPNFNPAAGFQPPPSPQNGNGNGNGKQPKYMTREEFLSGAVELLQIEERGRKLIREHSKLFKEDLEGLPDLIIEADTKGVKFEDVWAEKYGVHNKLEENRKAEVDTLVKKAFEDGKMQGLTERSIPTTAGLLSGVPRDRPSLASVLQDKPIEGRNSNDDIVTRALLDYRQRETERATKEGQSY